MSVREDIAFLVGSSCRVRMARVLAESAMRPTELATECSCARETAQRNLAEFRDRGWVEQTDKRYRLTPTGAVVLDAYEEMDATVQCASELSPFLSNVGGRVRDLSPRLLASQNVVTPTSEDPHAPINRYLSVLGTAPVDEYRGMAPIVSRVYNEAAERVIGPDTDMRLIIDRGVLRASKRAHPEALERAFELDQFRLLIARRPIQFGLTLVDDHAYLAAHDDDGNVVASVDGDDDAFYGRVEDVYETRRGSATVVTEYDDLPDFDGSEDLTHA